MKRINPVADKMIMFLGGSIIIYTGVTIDFRNPFLNILMIILGLYVILMPWLEEEKRESKVMGVTSCISEGEKN